MNKLETEVVQTPIREQEECAKFIIEDTYIPFVFNDVFEEIGVSHVFSFWVKSEHDGLISVSGQKYQTTQTWKKYVIIINPYDENLRLFFDEPGVYYMYNSQLEKGDYATDYRPAVGDVDFNISEASKTATNYLEFSDNGLIIGDHTAGTLVKNVLINSDSVDIRNGDTVLARYADKEIHLGMNSADSIIYLCGDTGYISATDNDGFYDTLQIVTPGYLSLRSDDTIGLSISNSHGYSSLYTICNANDTSLAMSVYNISGNTFIEALPTQIRLQSVASGGVADLFIDPIKREVRVDNGTFYVKNGSGVFDKGIAATGIISATGEIISTNPNGFRIARGNYGSFIRNDGNATYFMLTNSGDQYGNWNGLRPLIINNSTGNVTINNSALDATGDITPGRDLLVKNGYSIFCKNASGSQVNALHMNSSNVMIFGYGAYTMGYVARYAGAAVEIGTPQGNFRPYFRPGDSFTIRWYGAGTVTGSGKSLIFTIPLSKPAIGCSGVTVTTNSGFICRQNNAYCYGSGASTWTKDVASYSAAIDSNGQVRINASMNNNTNVTNNSAIGIDASVTITFV